MSIIFSRVNLLRSTKENTYYSCTVRDVVTVPYAMRFHGLDAILDLGLAWHILPRCHVISFSRPGEGIYFLTLVRRWNVGDFLFTIATVLFIVSQFSIKFFFIKENFHSKIIGCVDVMLTMCPAHCICFYEFKQDQLRSTRFNSITNYIFSLLKAIYSVVFAFVCHHFWKIYKKLNSETLTFLSH